MFCHSTHSEISVSYLNILNKKNWKMPKSFNPICQMKTLIVHYFLNSQICKDKDNGRHYFHKMKWVSTQPWSYV